MSKKSESQVKPNLPALRTRYLEALKAWRAALDAAGVDFYSVKAEGQLIGRGKARGPDALRKLFDAHEEARLAYLGGGV